MNEIEETLQITKALCDLITAQPISNDEKVKNFDFSNWEEDKNTILKSKVLLQAHSDLATQTPLHFPIQFPEIFLKDNPGFNVIIGNPPWEKAKVEEDAFYARHFPGLRGYIESEKRARVSEIKTNHPRLVKEYSIERKEADTLRLFLNCGNFPGMGTGDPDLYKAFCWRFWHLLTADEGRIGVVLPRSAMNAKGSTVFRKTLFNDACEINITSLLNNGKWIFEEIHGSIYNLSRQYT